MRIVTMTSKIRQNIVEEMLADRAKRAYDDIAFLFTVAVNGTFWPVPTDPDEADDMRDADLLEHPDWRLWQLMDYYGAEPAIDN